METNVLEIDQSLRIRLMNKSTDITGCVVLATFLPLSAHVAVGTTAAGDCINAHDVGAPAANAV
jgi:hypothetical protein